jgi:hypothetical protein
MGAKTCGDPPGSPVSPSTLSCLQLHQSSVCKGCVIGSGSNQFSKIHMFLNLELDYRFGSAESLNFELDLGLVQEGPGSNLGSELNHSNTNTGCQHHPKWP